VAGPSLSIAIPVFNEAASLQGLFEELGDALLGLETADFFARRLAEHRAGRADHRLCLYAHPVLAGWRATPEENR
jgi:hypothetical protein